MRKTPHTSVLEAYIYYNILSSFIKKKAIQDYYPRIGDVLEMNATICLCFTSPRELKTALEALDPETRFPLTSRCKVRLQGANNRLTFNFQARDTSALRAAINSYLRQTIMLRDVLGSLRSPALR